MSIQLHEYPSRSCETCDEPILHGQQVFIAQHRGLAPRVWHEDCVPPPDVCFDGGSWVGLDAEQVIADRHELMAEWWNDDEDGEG